MKVIDNTDTAVHVALEDTIATSKDALWCDLKGEAVILHMSSGVYFGLEGVGFDVWQLIQTPRTVAEVVADLRSRFDVSPHICEERTVSFVDDLAQHNLVVVTKHAVNE